MNIKTKKLVTIGAIGVPVVASAIAIGVAISTSNKNTTKYVAMESDNAKNNNLVVDNKSESNYSNVYFPKLNAGDFYKYIVLDPELKITDEGKAAIFKKVLKEGPFVDGELTYTVHDKKTNKGKDVIFNFHWKSSSGEKDSMSYIFHLTS